MPTHDPGGPGWRFLEGPRPFVDDEGLDPEEDDVDEGDDETETETEDDAE